MEGEDMKTTHRMEVGNSHILSNSLSNLSINSISRYEKGFYYESTIWNMLDRLGIEFKSNPKLFEDWLKTVNSGFDIKVLSKLVECKYLSKPIFYSWFKKSWLNKKADIIVCSNKWFVPYECRRILEEFNVKLMDTMEFYNYLLKSIRRISLASIRFYSLTNTYLNKIIKPMKIVAVGVAEVLKNLKTRLRNHSARQNRPIHIRYSSRHNGSTIVHRLKHLLKIGGE